MVCDTGEAATFQNTTPGTVCALFAQACSSLSLVLIQLKLRVKNSIAARSGDNVIKVFVYCDSLCILKNL
jgi:hypothetical protein